MIKSIRQANEFLKVILSGVKIKSIDEKLKAQILIDWMFQSVYLDETTTFYVERLEGTLCGIVQICSSPSVGITMTEESVRFHLLPIKPNDSKVETQEWIECWLYDLRVQTSVALFIRLVTEKYSHIANTES